MNKLLLISALFILVACESRKPENVLNPESSSYLGDSIANRDENNNDTADVLELFLENCDGDLSCAEDSVLYYMKHPQERTDLDWWPFTPSSSSSEDGSSGSELTCETNEVKVFVAGAHISGTTKLEACYAENEEFTVYADTIAGTNHCFDYWEDVTVGIDVVSDKGSLRTLKINGKDLSGPLYINATLQTCESGKMYRVNVIRGELDHYTNTTGLFEEGAEVIVNLLPGDWKTPGTCFANWTGVETASANTDSTVFVFTMPAEPLTIEAVTKTCDGITDVRTGTYIPTHSYGTGGVWTDNVSYTEPDWGNGWCYNDSTTCDENGRLYTYSVASSVCPFGWRLPTLEEYRAVQSVSEWSLAGFRTSGTNLYADQGTTGAFWTSSDFDTDFIVGTDRPEDCVDSENCAVGWWVTNSEKVGFRDLKTRALSVRCILSE